MKKIFLITILIILSLFSVCQAKTKPQKEEYNIEFFKKFQDDILLENLQKAYENNFDLKIAISKVKESQQIVKMSLAQELPQINFEPVITKTIASGDIQFGKNNYLIKNYNQSKFLLPVYVSYEVDIWGKNRLKTKSKSQSLKIIEQDKRATVILLSSSVAINYFNLIKTDELIKLNKELLELSKSSHKLLEKKFDNGLVNQYNLLSSKENIIQIQNSINSLENQREVLKNQISYLLGDNFFKDIKRNSFENTKDLFSTPETLQSSIILHRPDVIGSMENIKRASYDARVAKRELLPTFTILGTLGFNGYDNLKGIFKSNTGLAEFSVIPNWNIFDGGKRWHLIKLKKLEYERAQKEYEQTIISSIQEINDSLAILKKENLSYELAKDTLDIQNKKYTLKSRNKDAGLANELDLIQYKEYEIIAQANYVDNKINQIISAINLYRAAGGTDYTQEYL